MAVLKKNEEYVVEIIDNGYEGEGIAKIDNFTVFIPGAIKGEKMKILIVKVLSSHAFGKIIEIINKSENRQEPDCKTYKRCGGCNLRHVKYDTTLKMKQNSVQSLVNKTLQNKIHVNETVGMENPYNYRNKAQYPIGKDKNGEPVIGVYANRTHEVIPIKKCMIQNSESEKIAKKVIEFIKENNLSIYNEENHKGLFRHIVIKVGIKTQEIMCVLVINGKTIPQQDKLIKQLTSEFPQIKSIVKNINEKNTNVILGMENETIYGKGYIEDVLGEYTFKISPLSFYQVNTVQAEKIYRKALEFASPSVNDVIADLYCGAGTIGLSMAGNAEKIIGVEVIADAIENARRNSIVNNIPNAEFYCGDVEEVLKNLNIYPDIIVIDPPRKGCSPETIQIIAESSPKKIVMISCNPSTAARDVKLFSQLGYSARRVCGADLFPHTRHVECVVLMSRE